jgi:E3 ubiquitin-protein ligase UBR4
VSDVVSALNLADGDGSDRAQSPLDGDAHGENEADWLDDAGAAAAAGTTGGEDGEDSGAEDSDDDTFCNKLCTYIQTQKEFMNQHW